MIQTLRFTFAADATLYPSGAFMPREDKVYFAVLVVEIDENCLKEIISTTIVGILAAQETRYRRQGYYRWEPAKYPWLRDVIVKHFERDQERLRVVVERKRQWPQFHNGAGIRTPDDEPPTPLRPFLV